MTGRMKVSKNQIPPTLLDNCLAETDLLKYPPRAIEHLGSICSGNQGMHTHTVVEREMPFYLRGESSPWWGIGHRHCAPTPVS